MWFIRVDGFGIPNFKTIFVKFVLFDICVCLRALRRIGCVIERLWRLRQRNGAHQSDVLCACLPIIVRPQTIQTKSNIDSKWSARFFGRNWNHIESHLSGPNLPSPTDWSLTTFAYVSMIMLEKTELWNVGVSRWTGINLGLITDLMVNRQCQGQVLDV